MDTYATIQRVMTEITNYTASRLNTYIRVTGGKLAILLGSPFL